VAGPGRGALARSGEGRLEDGGHEAIELGAQTVDVEGEAQHDKAIDAATGLRYGDTVSWRSPRLRPSSASIAPSRSSGSSSSSGSRLNEYQPSPCRAARRIAAALSPPTWMGGCGCWTGLGYMRHAGSV
jgi:hypothetical protein